MTFLLGRQATFGQEPPTIERSTTTVFCPWLARVQARILPATPVTMIRFRTDSVAMRILLFVVKGSEAVREGARREVGVPPLGGLRRTRPASAGTPTPTDSFPVTGVSSTAVRADWRLSSRLR